jgi:type IV secretory pathway TraG/TraD family ATPase VirD4
MTEKYEGSSGGNDNLTGKTINSEGINFDGGIDKKTGEFHCVRHEGSEHMIIIAPTRSKNGISLFDSETSFSSRFNPFEVIRLGSDKEIGDVQNFVSVIFDPYGKGLNEHSEEAASDLLVGAILHVLYAEPDKTLTGVANFLSEPTRDVVTTLHYMQGTEHDEDGKRGWLDSLGNPTKTHPVVAVSARDMLNKSEDEMSGILSAAMSFLTLYRDPVVASNKG